ncbi:MAG: GPP34 family phosphoprotein [Propionibacteriaceae bacterium]|jgi:hypothetical protein|nr:GPP34 family phosphoprotein [Propionibacteriaceae bacterium]
MLLAETVLLLTTDEATGKKLCRNTDLLVAGALLADLALAGNVRVAEQGEGVRKNRALAVPDAAWPTDPMLAECLTIVDGKKHWSPSTLVERLGRKRVPQVYERLAVAEVLSRTEHRVLGMVPTTRWVTIDPGPVNRFRTRLDEVFLFGHAPDLETAAVAGLLYAADMVVPVLDRGRHLDRSKLKRQAKALMKQYWPAMALDRAIQARETAVVA